MMMMNLLNFSMPTKLNRSNIKSFKNPFASGFRMPKEKSIENVVFNLYSVSYFYVFILIGILSNIVFFVILNNYRKKFAWKHNKKSNGSMHQPLILILMTVVIGDIFYLLNELNEWLLANNLYVSINGLCQFLTYIFNYFVALNECHLAAANVFLIHFLCAKENQLLLQNESCSSETQFKFLKSESENLCSLVEVSCSENSSFPLRSADLNETKRIFRGKARKRRFNESDFRKVRLDGKNLDSNSIKHSSLVIYEKLLILFYSFILMYLLSFFFWIKEVKVYKILIYNSNKPYVSSRSVCEADKLTSRFLNYYLILFNFVRFLVLIFSFIVSILYIKKFYYYSANFLQKTLQKSMDEDEGQTNKNTSLFFKRLCLDFKSVSAPSPAELLKRKLVNHSFHLQLLQYYSIMTILYSMSVVCKIVYEIINHIGVALDSDSNSMNNLKSIANVENSYYKKFSSIEINYLYRESIVHLMEVIAHSNRFYVYILVIVHFKFFFK